MPKYSANQLRNALEVGHSSSWVVSFSNSGSNAPNTDKLNMIKTPDGNYSPVLDVSYDQDVITKISLTVGPGIDLGMPVFLASGENIDITFYDDHKKIIRQFIRDWTRNYLKISQGRSPALTDLKSYCILIHIQHFDNEQNNLEIDDVFYVLPDQSISFSGDQDFKADTLPIKFFIVGTQE